MNRFKYTGSSLFLMELIIAVLFFSLGSGLCIQVFAKAHMVSQSAKELSFSSSQVSSAASVVKYSDLTLDSLKKYFPGAEQEGDSFLIRYDSQFELCGREDMAYQLLIQAKTQEDRTESHIWMEDKDGEILYELDLRYPS